MPSTQTIEFRAVTGQTVTAKLFAAGSDTEVASVTATEATNRKGTYLAAFTDVAAGEYQLLAFNATPTPLASWWVTLTLTTATFQVYDRVDKDGITRNNWAALTVDHTSTGSFGYVVGLFFQLIENVTGWRFTSKALEQTPNVTVNITPAYVTQQAVVDNNKITVRRGSRGWVLLTVTDPTTGDPIDLSVYTGLKFLVGPAGETTIQTQDVSAFGADSNQFYWKPNEASTQKERQLNWSLFNVIDDTESQYYRAKPADGVINVLESPV